MGLYQNFIAFLCLNQCIKHCQAQETYICNLMFSDSQMETRTAFLVEGERYISIHYTCSEQDKLSQDVTSV